MRLTLRPLLAYLEDPVLATCLVFEATAMDKRKAVYKALVKHATVIGGRKDGDRRQRQRLAEFKDGCVPLSGPRLPTMIGVVVNGFGNATAGK